MQVHGPTVKMMRWYSWFESTSWYSGELWLTKLILLHGSGVHNPAEGLDDTFESPDTVDKNANPKEMLRQLKLKHGTWALAPRLITEESMWRRLLIFKIGGPSWTINSGRAKAALTPSQVADPWALT